MSNYTNYLKNSILHKMKREHNSNVDKLAKMEKEAETLKTTIREQADVIDTLGRSVDADNEKRREAAMRVMGLKPVENGLETAKLAAEHAKVEADKAAKIASEAAEFAAAVETQPVLYGTFERDELEAAARAAEWHKITTNPQITFLEQSGRAKIEIAAGEGNGMPRATLVTHDDLLRAFSIFEEKLSLPGSRSPIL